MEKKLKRKAIEKQKIKIEQQKLGIVNSREIVKLKFKQNGGW